MPDTPNLEMTDAVALNILKKFPSVKTVSERLLRAAAAEKLGVIVLDDYRRNRR